MNYGQLEASFNLGLCAYLPQVEQDYIPHI